MISDLKSPLPTYQSPRYRPIYLKEKITFDYMSLPPLPHDVSLPLAFLVLFVLLILILFRM